MTEDAAALNQAYNVAARRDDHAQRAVRDHPHAARAAPAAPGRRARGAPRAAPRRHAALARRHRQGAAPARLPADHARDGRAGKHHGLVHRESFAGAGTAKEGGAMSEVLEKIDLQKQTAPALATVAVVGLGYVGLPVAVAFGKHRPTIGYDLSKRRVENLKHMVDATGEVSTAELIEAKHLKRHGARRRPAARRLHHRRGAHADQRRAPARSLAARVGERGGRPPHEAGRDRDLRVDRLSRARTEEVCVPILEKRLRHALEAGLPRRLLARSASIPATRSTRSPRSLKVVSGDDADTLEKVAALYGSVVKAGVYRAPLDQGRRGGQGDREHAARPEHRLRQRARHHLRAARHRHRARCSRPPAPSGTSCRSAPAWSAATASASTRTTSRTRPSWPATTREVILAGRRINDGMGSAHRAQDRAADDPRRAQHQGRARQRARPHLQGERARHPQLEGGRHPRASCTSSASRRYVHDPLASAGGRAARVRRQAALAGTSCRRPTR